MLDRYKVMRIYLISLSSRLSSALCFFVATNGGDMGKMQRHERRGRSTQKGWLGRRHSIKAKKVSFLAEAEHAGSAPTKHLSMCLTSI